MHRKVILAIVVALLGLTPVANAGMFRGPRPSPSSMTPSSSVVKTIKVRTTAYTHTEDDHLEYKKLTAAGSRLQASRRYNSAAADWSRFPVGTVFKIRGSRTKYVIDDYGSALVGTGTIDIYHRNKRNMNKWGVRHVEIEILKMGSYEKSREILKPRLKHDHCRQMYIALVGRSAWNAIAANF